MSLAELERLLASMGEQPYRGRQVAEWLYRHGASAFAEMTTLSKGLRERLEREARIGKLDPAAETTSAGGDARKWLFRFEDGEAVETVLMRLRNSRSVCLSTQVGCQAGCRFCATGALGFRRNLTAGEIVGQFLEVRRLLAEEERPTHAVFMGMGEPLLNPDAVERAIRILLSPEGPALGPRRITVSTCGIVPGIRRLAAAGLRTELAVSLIAADEQTRRRLFPPAEAYPLAEVVRAAGDYAAAIGRPVTFEYVLLKGINDSLPDAQRLKKLIRGIPCKVNLIRYNPAPAQGSASSVESLPPRARGEESGSPPGEAGARAASFEASAESRLAEFQRWLASSCIAVTVRRSKGAGIGAACGQLGASRRAAGRF